MFYGAIVWDPWLILSQIVCLQCVYYLTLGVFLSILVGARVSKMSLVYFFDFSTLTASTVTGWCAMVSFLLSSAAGAAYMLYLIERAKKCLDFSATLYIVHLFICVIYGGWPSSFTWWIVNLTCLALMALLGEWLCIRRELREIPITRLRSNSSFVPPIIYAIFGSSKNLAVGTVAAASLLMASMIGNEVSPVEEPELYAQLFYTAAFAAGIFQLGLGIFRLGILIDFLSRSTVTGFMGGTAIIIILQQLKGMLGLVHFTHRTDVVSVLHSVFSSRRDWRWESAVLGILFLGILLYTRHLKTTTPKLFWVSTVTPLLLVVVGGLFTFLVNGADHGIPIVGDLKRGLNPVSAGKLQLRSKHFDVAFKAGIVAGCIALTEGIAVGRSLAQQSNDQIDGNKEMIAFGMMNIFGSFFSCYLTTGPFSKSAVNFNAGCRTQMSNMVQAFIMMLVLLLLAPFFKYTPLVVLSAIIIVAMIGLIEYEEIYHQFKVDKYDFVICMIAFLGVAFSEMKIGIMASVGASILRALVYIARPHTCKLGRLGNIGGTEVYRDPEQYPDATSIPGILILQPGSPIYFANAGYLKERISRLLEEENNIMKKNGDEVQYIILDLSGVSSMDHSGIGMLEELNKSFQDRGIRLALANPRIRVVDKLVRSGVVDLIGAEWIFLTLKESVRACRFSLEQFSKQKGEHA